MYLSLIKPALEQARAAAVRGEVPVGAVLSGPDGQVLAQDGNRTRELQDPTAHAEMLVLRAGARLLGEARLAECTLYVTLEPCAMCAGAISHARIKKLIYGAYDAKGGAVEHGPRFFGQPTCLHAPEVVGGVEEAACAQLLKDFFGGLRSFQR